MKTKFIQILYSLTAFLADRTKGFPLFSKWKIALGSLLIGLTVVSCKQKAILTLTSQQIKSNKDSSLYMLNEKRSKAETGHIENIITCYVANMPQFPGGEEAMMMFIKENIKYPEEAIQNKIEGRVYVQFAIDTNGTISNIEVRKSPNESLSKEAIRIIELMPKWIPTNHVYLYGIPIVFKLKDQ